MKHIFIIGGGFAGLSAASYLRKYRKQIVVTLIDKKEQFNFSPLLPDIISRRISGEFLSLSLNKLSQKLYCGFINSEVKSINFRERKIYCLDQSFDYDYLINASGSKTNFYGNQTLEKYARKLDDLSDGMKILEGLDSGNFEVFVVSGGGYTGIEMATNLWRYFDKKKKSKKIIIVEKSNQLLGMLPEWMKEYVAANLRKMGIEVRLDAEIKEVSKDRILLKDGECFQKAMLIWAAGVKTQELIKDPDILADRQGRAIVDENLGVNDNCFYAGDSAHFEHKGIPLRMSVQFAITQGRLAAKNAVNRMLKRKLEKYSPVDLGFIIPMANNKACGIVFGIKIKGFLAIMCHYSMCVFRSISLRNKLGIIGNLFTSI